MRNKEYLGLPLGNLKKWKVIPTSRKWISANGENEPVLEMMVASVTAKMTENLSYAAGVFCVC